MIQELSAIDLTLIDSLRGPWLENLPRDHHWRKVHMNPDIRDGCIEFCPPALDRLAQPAERLNDVCLNSGALLLQHLFTHERYGLRQARECAIFTSFDIYLSRYNRSNSEVWRRTKETRYWDKDIWLLPIHREHPTKHWILSIIYPWHRCIYLYDSLASGLGAWKDEIKVRPIFGKRKIMPVIAVYSLGYQVSPHEAGCLCGGQRSPCQP
jgi:hypothetical protein